MALSLQLEDKATTTSTTTNRPPAAAGPRSGIAQLRVHANEVEQPLGRALFMLGAGPMLITDNRLLSEGTGDPATDVLASTVLVGNLGLSREWNVGLLGALLYRLYVQIFGKGSDNAEQTVICTISRLCHACCRGIWTRMPTGKLMFNNSQVSFLMRDALRDVDLASTLLLSLDDIGAATTRSNTTPSSASRWPT